MKFSKTIKAFLFSLLILPCVLLFSACDTNGAVIAVNTYILNIEKTSTEGLTDTYTITYSDGTTSTFTITNGKDGANGRDGADAENISLSELYAEAVANGTFSGTYIEFLKEYLQTNGISKEAAASNLGLLSAVSVSLSYTYTQYYGNPFYGYQPIESSVTQYGSGVIYKLDKTAGDAYIITNYHVVYGSYKGEIIENVKLNIYGHQTANEAIDAVYIGGSMFYDIAVLKVTGSDLLKSADCVAVENRFANSDDIAVGSAAIAIGNPDGAGISVTNGVVSVDSEYVTMTAVDNSTQIKYRSIRIDTSINGGNSGGALYNDDGQVIGIVNIGKTASSSENIAYAIPSNIAKYVADNIMYNAEVNPTSKQVSKFSLGVDTEVESSSAVLDTDQTITIVEQVAVKEVLDGSFAKTALGLSVGDIITKIKIDENEYNITRTFQVSDIALLVRPNAQITIYFTRGGSASSATATAQSTYFAAVS